MIKDEKLGLKIAEDPIEANWDRIVSSAKERILQTEIGLEIDREILRYAKNKLKSMQNGHKGK